MGAADTFEFQVVAPHLGIAHPTGYPLYLLLGKLFSLLPVGAVAWRLNLASAVFALGATVAVFRLGLALSRRPLPALVGAVALGLVPIYWSQAIVAEVYTLHALIVAVALLAVPAAAQASTVGRQGELITYTGTDGVVDVFDLSENGVDVVFNVNVAGPTNGCGVFHFRLGTGACRFRPPHRRDG